MATFRFSELAESVIDYDQLSTKKLGHDLEFKDSDDNNDALIPWVKPLDYY